MNNKTAKIRFVFDMLVLLLFFSAAGIGTYYYYFFKSQPPVSNTTLQNAAPSLNIKHLLKTVRQTKPSKPLNSWIPASLSNRWKYIVIHHSATGSGNAAIFDKNHQTSGFENGLGYHFVICNGNGGRDGLVEIGKRWKNQIQGGHLKGDDLDEISIGICLVGDFTVSSPTVSQIASLKSLLIQLQKITNIPDNDIQPHKKMPEQTTACPGLLPVKELIKFKNPE